MRLEAASTLLHKMAAQFCGDPDLSPHKMAAQFCGDPDPRHACVSRFFHPTKWLRNFAGTPVSGMLVYLVPPARSRYCASPEASIMRLEAASTLLHKMAAQFCGDPDPRHVPVIAPLLRRQYPSTPSTLSTLSTPSTLQLLIYTGRYGERPYIAQRRQPQH